jgi:hypothetical protein
MLGKSLCGRRDVVVLLNRTPKYEVMLPQILEMAEAGSGIDLISRALGIGAEVVRDALYLHRTGKRPPGRIDGRRRRPRKPGQPFVPRYKQIAAEVDRRRKAGEGFDRLACEMRVSRGTVLRAYDFANRDEAAAVIRNDRGNGAADVRRIVLRFVGTAGNRDAIGTLVTATTGDGVRRQQVQGGGGYQSSRDRRLLFALPADSATAFTVRWPGGRSESLPIPAGNGQWLVIEPPSADTAARIHREEPLR